MRVISFLARIGENAHAINIWLGILLLLHENMKKSLGYVYFFRTTVCFSFMLTYISPCTCYFLRARALGLYLNCDSYLRPL